MQHNCYVPLVWRDRAAVIVDRVTITFCFHWLKLLSDEGCIYVGMFWGINVMRMCSVCWYVICLHARMIVLKKDVAFSFNSWYPIPHHATHTVRWTMCIACNAWRTWELCFPSYVSSKKNVWMFKPEFGNFLFNPYRKGFWSLKYSPPTPGCEKLNVVCAWGAAVFDVWPSVAWTIG